MAALATVPRISTLPEAQPQPDWRRVASLMHASRALDDLEERRLVPQRRVLYQFSARGHELAQVLLGLQLTDPHDGVAVYYRSRPVVLALGVSLEDAAAGPLMRAESFSGGRDIGVLFNRPGGGVPTVLPACGGVGTQYTPAAGWAQALRYRAETLADAAFARGIAVALGGDASTATNGFWSALNIATTCALPMLFFIEDNAFGISVPAHLQTPGGNIAANLRAFDGLCVLEGSGSDPREAAALVARAVDHVRTARAPALLRLTVPRLCGHSGQDTQAYKSAEVLREERAHDPLARLHEFLVPGMMSEGQWAQLTEEAQRAVSSAVETALARPAPDAGSLERHVFAGAELQRQGGVAPEGHAFASSSPHARPEPPRINMLTAIRRTLDVELAANPRMLVFGEDVGPKGGVHGATLGLQEKYGAARVFDTSLSEEGIVGRAVGMAIAGLLPVPEIQFRKYAEPATEQLSDCGTLRWRTCNRFAAPMVVRMPGGYFKCGDPWHSQTNEVAWLHAIGWRLAMPSNAEDAAGLLRAALRGNDPVIFFEHRAMLDGAWARRPWPGNDFVVPFGKARVIRSGTELTVVTWGAMVERCEQAALESQVDAEVLDLRTLSPWDRDAVRTSVQKTRRCLIVHEDNLTAGFGAEIAAQLAEESFASLAAPIVRLAMPDVPSPHSPVLMDAAVPDAARICRAIRRLALTVATHIEIRAPAEQTEGTRSQLLRWLKRAGEPVAENEPLIELETDKVTVEIAAPASGVLREILKHEQEEVAPGELLGRIEAAVAPAEAAAAPTMPVGAVSSHAAPGVADAVAPRAAPGPQTRGTSPGPSGAISGAHPAGTGASPPATSTAGTGATQAGPGLSPAVRRLLAEHGLEAGAVHGTGPAGRITVEDILQAAAARTVPGERTSFAERTAPVEGGSPAPPAMAPASGQGIRRVPHTAIRRRIAEHMVQSLLHTAPHVTTVFEADLGAVLEDRARRREDFASRGAPLTLTAYFVQAAVAAIRVVPEANSRWTDEALEIHEEVHIGIATAVEGSGLVVPVLRDAQARDLLATAQGLGELVGRARSGKLTPADVRGGTFTISNHGVSGSLLAAPIVINQPQAAILGVGKLEKRAVVIEDGDEERIGVRPRCYVTLTLDHRVMDGYEANRFLEAFVTCLERWPPAA